MVDAMWSLMVISDLICTIENHNLQETEKLKAGKTLNNPGK